MEKNRHGQHYIIKVQKNVNLPKNVRMKALFNSVCFFYVKFDCSGHRWGIGQWGFNVQN